MSTPASSSPRIEALLCEFLAEVSLHRRVGLPLEVEVVAAAQYKNVRENYDVLLADLRAFGMAAWAVPSESEVVGDEDHRSVLALNDAAGRATGRSVAEGEAINAAIGDPDVAPLLSCLGG